MSKKMHRRKEFCLRHYQMNRYDCLILLLINNLFELLSRQNKKIFYLLDNYKRLRKLVLVSYKNPLLLLIGSLPQMNALPIEVKERLIMKAMILVTRSDWEMTSRAEVSVYESLSTVCTMWYRIISGRSWFRGTLSKRFFSSFTNIGMLYIQRYQTFTKCMCR